jgi:hypothetical protein
MQDENVLKGLVTEVYANNELNEVKMQDATSKVTRE